MKIEKEIESLISSELEDLNRPDLFRAPLVAFSSAQDKRYLELKTIIGEWHQLPTEILSAANSVISYYVPFTKKVANDPRRSKDLPIWGEAYVVLNEFFIQINEVICKFLQEKGYSAESTLATASFDTGNVSSNWSQKSAAVIAGLGNFGANRMLITEKGSAGRVSSVVTSAVLNKEVPPVNTLCLYLKNGTCGRCFKVCPTKALQPHSWDRFLCYAETQVHRKEIEENYQIKGAEVCGRCVSTCPLAYID